MQTRVQKIFLFFFLTVCWQANGATYGHEANLFYADSLFENQKFTEAFQMYEALLEKGGVFSPRMLLRMAYVKEARQEYPEALYYLNLYYYYTAQTNTGVLGKMDALANSQKYSGYEIRDFEYFISAFRRYYHILGGVSLLFFSFVLWRMYVARARGESVTGYAIVLTLMIGGVYAVFNYGSGFRRAIVVQNALMMEGPSAAAPKVEDITEGDRIVVLDYADIWVKVRTAKKQEGYIRKDNLLMVPPL